MKWQHWLDPVGQYTSLIVAVKSQFVFGAHIVGFSSTGNPACAPSCYLSAVAVRGSYGAMGGFGSGDSRTRVRLGRFSQASTRRGVLSCWRRLRPTLPKERQGAGAKQWKSCCVVALAQAGLPVLLNYATGWRIFRRGGACALAAFCVAGRGRWD